MNPLQQLAEHLGIQVADGDTLTVAMVTEALDGHAPDRETMGMVVAAHEAFRLAGVAEPYAGVDAELAQLTEAGQSYRDRIVSAENIGQAAPLEALPDIVEPDAPAEPVAEAEPETPAATPAPTPGSVQAADTDEPPALEVVARRGYTGNQVEITAPAGDDVQASEAIAASVGLAIKTTGPDQIDVPFPIGKTQDTAFAAAVCATGQDYGYCGPPAIDLTQTVCGTNLWPEAAAFTGLGIARDPGQAVLVNNVWKPTDNGFVWGSVERASQYIRDGQGKLVLGADGRPQVNPSASTKGCPPLLCGDMALWADEMVGQCVTVPVDYNPASIPPLIQSLMNDHTRSLARRQLTWMAGLASWTTPSAGLAAPVNARNMAARLFAVIAAEITALARRQGVAQIDVDIFGPAILPMMVGGEDFLRPELGTVWQELVARVASIGGTFQLSLDHFIDATYNGTSTPVATDLVAAGSSTWETAPLADRDNTTPLGTIATARSLPALPNNLPLLFAERGSIVHEANDFVSINFGGDIRNTPVGTQDLVRNQRTMFVEQNVIRAHRSCSPIGGVMLCVEPRGETVAGRAIVAGEGACDAPVEEG